MMKNLIENSLDLKDGVLWPKIIDTTLHCICDDFCISRLRQKPNKNAIETNEKRNNQIFISNGPNSEEEYPALSAAVVVNVTELM